MNANAPSATRHAFAKKRWYVVHVYSGMEKSVQRTLQKRIDQATAIRAKFGRILVPTEEVVEVKGGRELVSERRFYPGYILVEMEMTDETWHFVNDTKGVTGFVGGARKSTGGIRKGFVTDARPSPIHEQEIDQILLQMQGGGKPRPKQSFKVGEVVRIKNGTGPFAEFNGSVEEIDYEKSQLTVAVMVFNRPTPIKFEFSQVEKLSDFS